MPTLVCVPIMVDSIDAALRDADLAKLKGADLVEFRIDPYFHGSAGGAGSDAEDQVIINELQRLLAESPLPVVLTCRSASEGGDYDGDEVDRVALLEKLTAGCDTPPAYLDFELACYQKSANIKQKINLCVTHKTQKRDVSTRLILSIHDFEGRPADLDRRLLAAYDEPACAIVKVAYRARSIRDNLDLFEITQGAHKPTIALGMGEFGLMSRVLAPKFNGFMTFASLSSEASTAPGQPTIDELLGLYRFRTINPKTFVYGIIGWPVGHSLSPLIHNAGFEAWGFDGVYLPMPVVADSENPENSRLSVETTLRVFMESERLDFRGASVTIPFKEALSKIAQQPGLSFSRRTGTEYRLRAERIRAEPKLDPLSLIGAANTIADVGEQVWPDEGEPSWETDGYEVTNTDATAIEHMLWEPLGNLISPSVTIFGAGGVARAAAASAMECGAIVRVWNRNHKRAVAFVDDLHARRDPTWKGDILAIELEDLTEVSSHVYINCTPVGMTGGPDPDSLSIPIDKLPPLPPETVFFDTVYNPIETPMLKAAKAAGYTTIDGVQMFVKQAALQFELWTGKAAPKKLFNRLCRERLGSD